MSASEEPGGGKLQRSVAVSTRIYRRLTRLYPTELREEHAEEMVGCFRELCLREMRSRGRGGLGLLWSRTVIELAFTALRERSAALPTNAYLPVAPTTAARWGAVSALVGGLLGMAYDLVMHLQPVGTRTWAVPSVPSQLPFFFATLLAMLGLLGIYGMLAARKERPGSLPGRIAAAGAVLAALALAAFLVASLMRLGAYTGVEAPSMSPDALHWGPWWYRELQWVVQLTALLSWVIGLSLLAVAASRERMLGAMRLVPLVVVVLLLSQQVHDDFTRVLSYSLPFLGSAILGWALLKTEGGEADGEKSVSDRDRDIEEIPARSPEERFGDKQAGKRA